MEFKKYQHVERFGNVRVEGIEKGKCYIFPKLDGTNSSVWINNGELQAGSRNRQLSLEKDNAGFFSEILKNDKVKNFLKKYPDLRLYGEFLVPHTLKNYKKDAWKKFYVFDVMDNNNEYLEYEMYSPLLDEFEIQYIKPIAIIEDGDYFKFLEVLQKNTYLIEEGIGEGVVIKNYDYVNRYGDKNWAKLIATEFLDKKKSSKKVVDKELQIIEEKIVQKMLTNAFIEKEYAKIVLNEAWSSELVPKLISIIYTSFVEEEILNILKKFKSPKIDFKILNKCVVNKIKEEKKELFS